MIDAHTRGHKAEAPALVDGVYLGAVSTSSHASRLSLKTRIYDDFNNGVRDWVNVRGRLTTTGGATPDITSDQDWWNPFTWLAGAVGYHRTQMLSDSIRVKVTIPDGPIINGTSQFWFCGDRRMEHYYGIQVSTVLGVDSLAIIKGTSPSSWRTFGRTSVSLSSGQSVEGWYDAQNSTIRMYHNGVEKETLQVSPLEIPHGPGHRWVGVIMAADWWIAPGGNFADFEAWDV